MPDDLYIERKIGSGGFAQVYQAQWQGVDVAVKVLKHSHRRRGGDDASEENEAFDADLQSFMQEMAMLSELRHPYVLAMMGGYHDMNTSFIVTELCAGGSLTDYIHGRTGDHVYTAFNRTRIAREIAVGMLHLHSATPPIIHRDLKSMNVLLSGDLVTKIADFGLSRAQEGSDLTLKVGTPFWMAPEVLKGESYDLSADVFAYGVMLWEMVARAKPFRRSSPIEYMSQLLRDNDFRETIPEHTNSAWRTLIQVCWHTDPALRPSFAQIITYFDEHWDDLEDISAEKQQRGRNSTVDSSSSVGNKNSTKANTHNGAQHAFERAMQGLGSTPSLPSDSQNLSVSANRHNSLSVPKTATLDRAELLQPDAVTLGAGQVPTASEAMPAPLPPLVPKKELKKDNDDKDDKDKDE